MRAPILRLGLALFASFVAHHLVFQQLQKAPTSEHERFAESSKRRVPIRIYREVSEFEPKQQPTVSARPENSAPPPKGEQKSLEKSESKGSKKPKKPRPSGSRSEQIQKAAKTPRTYEDLFPGPSEGVRRAQKGRGSGDSDHGYYGTGANLAAEELLGRFSIPLKFRKTTDSGEARAKLRITDGRWKLGYVAGDPVFRAILYEAVQKKENREAVGRVMKAMDSTELLVVLRYRTRASWHGSGESRDWMLEPGKLIVLRTRYRSDGTSAPRAPASPGVSGGIGMTLPDREAERAKERDRGALRKLRRSPAYRRPLRGRDLGPVTG